MSAPRLHPFWRLLLCAIGVIFVVSIVQTIGLLALIPFASQLGAGGMPILKQIGFLGDKYALYIATAAYPALLGTIYFFRTQVDRYSWRSLGFSRKRVAPDMALGGLAALLTLSVLFALMWLSGAIHFGGTTTDVQAHSWLYSAVQLLVFGVAFLGTGLFEETLFRGYTLANACQWLGWKGAVALQAVIFASIHLMNGFGKPDVLKAAFMAMPNIGLIAVFFALSYRKTGSLWFPIGFHLGWNWLLGCVFSLPVSGIPTFHLFDIQANGNSLITGGQFGAEASVLLIPLVAAMCYFISLAPDHPRAVANLDNPEPSRSALPMVPIAQYTPVQPVYAVASSAPLPAMSINEDEEEPRGNRFKARFGSAEGFDSGMLGELKQMQHVREEAERSRIETQRAAQRAEEAQKDALNRAQLAAQSLQAQQETQPLIPSEPTVPEVVAPEVTIPKLEPVAATQQTSEVAPTSVESIEPVAATTPMPHPPTPVEPRVEVPVEPAVTPSLPAVGPSIEPSPAVPVISAPTAPVVPVAPLPPQPVAPGPDAPSGETQEPTPQTPKKTRPRW